MLPDLREGQAVKAAHVDVAGGAAAATRVRRHFTQYKCFVVS